MFLFRGKATSKDSVFTIGNRLNMDMFKVVIVSNKVLKTTIYPRSSIEVSQYLEHHVLRQEPPIVTSLLRHTVK